MVINNCIFVFIFLSVNNMEKTPKIVFPDPIEVNKIHNKLDIFSKKGETFFKWFGWDIIDTLFYLYLFNKYKNNCLVKPNTIIRSKNSVGLELIIKQSGFNKIEYESQLNDIANQISNCIINKNTKNFILPLYLNLPGNNGHANVLIYRQNNHTFEHFEPHGKQISISDEKINKLVLTRLTDFIKILNGILSKNKIPPVLLKKSSDVCPYIKGFQTLENETYFNTKTEGKGYCSAWSMFFTELALKNPTIDSSMLINIIFDKIDGDPGKNMYLKKVIRGYANYISSKINKYFSIIFNGEITLEYLNTQISKKNNVFLTKFVKVFNELIEIEKILINNPKITKRQLINDYEYELLSASLQNKEKIQNRLKLLNDLHIFDEMSMSESLSPTKSSKNEKSQSNNKTKKQKPPSKHNLPKQQNPNDNVLDNIFSLIIKPNCPEDKIFDAKKDKCIKISKTKTQKEKTQTIKKITTLKQCNPGEEINPDTGRCRKIKVYPPCLEGKIRDPITHRCKKQK